MSDWRELSRLPESSEYWRALQRRIGGAASPELAAQRAHQRWINRGLAGGVLAAAACVAALLLAPPASSDGQVSLEAGLAPADPLARELLSSPEPPPVGGLLVTYARLEP